MGRDPDSERPHTPILPAWWLSTTLLLTPPPRPHLRRRDPEKGPRAGIPAPGVLSALRAGGARSSLPLSSKTLAFLSFPLPRSFSYFLSSGTRFLFLSPRSRPFFCPAVFQRLCLPLFHIISRSPDFCAGSLWVLRGLCMSGSGSLGWSLQYSVAARPSALPRSGYPLGSSLTPPGSCHSPPAPSQPL